MRKYWTLHQTAPLKHRATGRRPACREAMIWRHCRNWLSLHGDRVSGQKGFRRQLGRQCDSRHHQLCRFRGGRAHSNGHKPRRHPNTGTLIGAGAAGLDLDSSIVTNIGGTIEANAGCFVYLEGSTKVIGGRLNTSATETSSSKMQFSTAAALTQSPMTEISKFNLPARPRASSPKASQSTMMLKVALQPLCGTGYLVGREPFRKTRPKTRPAGRAGS
jgi:hypothetical protein